MRFTIQAFNCGASSSGNSIASSCTRPREVRKHARRQLSALIAQLASFWAVICGWKIVEVERIGCSFGGEVDVFFAALRCLTLEITTTRGASSHELKLTNSAKIYFSYGLRNEQATFESILN